MRDETSETAWEWEILDLALIQNAVVNYNHAMQRFEGITYQALSYHWRVVAETMTVTQIPVEPF